MKRWWLFTQERFEPVSHFLMIGLFVGAHVALTTRFFGNGVCFWGSAAEGGLKLLAALVLTVVFFFKLRLYDEIKDYETDLRVNPTRPLARGLVTHKEMYTAIALCLASEAILAASISFLTLGLMLPVMAYSLLMYKEFFIPRLIRPLLTTYAVMHTVVCSMLSVVLLVALAEIYAQSYHWSQYVLFALASWALFNIFEFGRKTFSAAEERADVASYSKVFGRYGAVALVLLMGLSALACLKVLWGAQQGRSLLMLVLSLETLLMAVSGILYALSNGPLLARIYRTLSSVYIIAFYLAFIILI